VFFVSASAPNNALDQQHNAVHRHSPRADPNNPPHTISTSTTVRRWPIWTATKTGPAPRTRAPIHLHTSSRCPHGGTRDARAVIFTDNIPSGDDLRFPPRDADRRVAPSPSPPPSRPAAVSGTIFSPPARPRRGPTAHHPTCLTQHASDPDGSTSTTRRSSPHHQRPQPRQHSSTATDLHILFGAWRSPNGPETANAGTQITSKLHPDR